MVSNDACDTGGAEFKHPVSEIVLLRPETTQDERCCSDKPKGPNMTDTDILTV